MTIQSFKELPINENIKRAIEEMGYLLPTPIQAQAIPIVLENKDLIGQAQTGTGKTAAYSLPILNKIDVNNYAIQALILCPTRELAIQVTKEIRKMCLYLEGVKVVPVYGGQSYDIQINALKKKPQIIVGTPGRIIDLMNRALLRFEDINTVVLDEADEMLKMGFQEDLETILGATPNQRQTVMFSATMPAPIIGIANKYLKNYQLVKIENKTITVEKIEQYYYLCKSEQKIDILVRLLDFYNIKSAIVFSNTKKDVDELVVMLQNNGYVTEGIHGDLKQSQRDRVMNSFRSSSVQVLVATDVAARGLDIDDVEVVFNYDIPLEEELYVHRIGRTGRAGKTGKAFTFVTKRQEHKIHQIEQYINAKIGIGKIPTPKDIRDAKIIEFYNKIKGKIDLELNSDDYKFITNKLISEGYNEEKIINTLISMIISFEEKEYRNIDEVIVGPKKDKKVRDSRKERIDNRKDRTEVRKEKREKFIQEKVEKDVSSNKKVLVYFDIGSRQEIKVVDILDFLKNTHKINKKDIGVIEITKKATYVELSENDARQLFKSKRENKIKNHDVIIEVIK